MKKKVLAIIFVLSLIIAMMATSVVAATVVAFDDFNRADGPLGSNWTDVQNFMQVYSMRAQPGASSWCAATYNGATGTILEADVISNGVDVQYAGFLMNYLSNSNTLFIKIQDNSAGYNAGFDTIWIYYGLHGSGLSIQNYTFAPIITAHMRVELDGGMLYIDLSNINGGAGTASYSENVTSYLPSLGTGVGIAAYKAAQLDNFSISTEIIGIDIDIDIKPGSDPNSINLRSKGVVPVAILSTATFDASNVDPVTVELTGSLGSASPIKWKMLDVPEVWDEGQGMYIGDGDQDLLLFFDTRELADSVLDPADIEATLTGLTYGGTPVEGTDSVRIVTKGPHT